MINIAILGNGTVGSGVLELIYKNKEKIKKVTGKTLNVKKILVKNMEKNFRKSNMNLFTDDIEEIFDEDIDIVVEVMGGIAPTKDYINEFIKRKVSVVTANKDLISKYGDELLALAYENKVKIYYEASVGGGIPIIKPLTECLLGNEIKSVKGILNGTTNYILSKMFNENVSYKEALNEAKKLGFAESDPTSDVKGFDAARKINILSSIAYEKKISLEDINIEGIDDIDEIDIAIAKENGYKIKLVAMSEKCEKGIYESVRPVFVKTNSKFYEIDDEFNGIIIDGDAVGEVFFYGKGAGKLPTASAVFGDIVDIIKNKKSHFKPLKTAKILKEYNKKSRWILRIDSKDTVKVLYNLSKVFKNFEFEDKKYLGKKDLVVFVETDSEKEVNEAVEKLRKCDHVNSIKVMMELGDFI